MDWKLKDYTLQRNVYVDIMHQDLSTSKEQPWDTNFIWYTTPQFMPEYGQNYKGKKKKERSALKMLLIQVGLQLRDRRKDNVFI